MSKIKFRVFCGVPFGIEIGMHDVSEINFEEETVSFYAIDPHDEESVSFCYPFSDVEIMQSSPFIDMHGNIIYDGDIVTSNGNIKIVAKDAINGGFSININELVYEDLTFEIAELVEVIGNIHQDKELLDGDKNE